MTPTQYSTIPLPWEAPRGAAGSGVQEFPMLTTVSQRGASLKVHTPCPGAFRGGGKRGRIREMSNASRRRLGHQFAAVKPAAFEAGGTLLSLTIEPGKYRNDGRFYNLQRRRFFAAFERAYPFAFFWRWERGKLSGRLHLHMLVFGVKWDRQTKPEKLVKAWGLGFVDCSPVEGARVFRYLTKYVSKPGSLEDAFNVADVDTAGGTLRGASGGPAKRGEPEHPRGSAVSSPAPDLNTAHIVTERDYTFPGLGRWWGLRRLETLDLAEPDVVSCVPDAVRRCALADVRRWVRNWIKAQKRAWGGSPFYPLDHVGSWFHGRKVSRRHLAEYRAMLRRSDDSPERKEYLLRDAERHIRAEIGRATPARCDWLRRADFASWSAICPGHNVMVSDLLVLSILSTLDDMERGAPRLGLDENRAGRFAFNHKAQGRIAS